MLWNIFIHASQTAMVALEPEVTEDDNSRQDGLRSKLGHHSNSTRSFLYEAITLSESGEMRKLAEWYRANNKTIADVYPEIFQDILSEADHIKEKVNQLVPETNESLLLGILSDLADWASQIDNGEIFVDYNGSERILDLLSSDKISDQVVKESRKLWVSVFQNNDGAILKLLLSRKDVYERIGSALSSVKNSDELDLTFLTIAGVLLRRSQSEKVGVEAEMMENRLLKLVKSRVSKNPKFLAKAKQILADIEKMNPEKIQETENSKSSEL
jgi:hypothetical protein